MAEFGFESAIVYSLYKPLHDKNYSEVNDVMNIFKLVYKLLYLLSLLFFTSSFDGQNLGTLRGVRYYLHYTMKYPLIHLA